jgi:hypothetical protein
MMAKKLMQAYENTASLNVRVDKVLKTRFDKFCKGRNTKQNLVAQALIEKMDRETIKSKIS